MRRNVSATTPKDLPHEITLLRHGTSTSDPVFAGQNGADSLRRLFVPCVPPPRRTNLEPSNFSTEHAETHKPGIPLRPRLPSPLPLQHNIHQAVSTDRRKTHAVGGAELLTSLLQSQSANDNIKESADTMQVASEPLTNCCANFSEPVEPLGAARETRHSTERHAEVNTDHQDPVWNDLSRRCIKTFLSFWNSDHAKRLSLPQPPPYNGVHIRVEGVDGEARAGGWRSNETCNHAEMTTLPSASRANHGIHTMAEEAPRLLQLQLNEPPSRLLNTQRVFRYNSADGNGTPLPNGNKGSTEVAVPKDKRKEHPMLSNHDHQQPSGQHLRVNSHPPRQAGGNIFSSLHPVNTMSVAFTQHREQSTSCLNTPHKKPPGSLGLPNQLPHAAHIRSSTRTSGVESWCSSSANRSVKRQQIGVQVVSMPQDPLAVQNESTSRIEPRSFEELILSAVAYGATLQNYVRNTSSEKTLATILTRIAENPHISTELLNGVMNGVRRAPMAHKNQGSSSVPVICEGDYVGTLAAGTISNIERMWHNRPNKRRRLWYDLIFDALPHSSPKDVMDSIQTLMPVPRAGVLSPRYDFLRIPTPATMAHELACCFSTSPPDPLLRELLKSKWLIKGPLQDEIPVWVESLTGPPPKEVLCHRDPQHQATETMASYCKPRKTIRMQTVTKVSLGPANSLSTTANGIAMDSSGKTPTAGQAGMPVPNSKSLSNETAAWTINGSERPFDMVKRHTGWHPYVWFLMCRRPEMYELGVEAGRVAKIAGEEWGEIQKQSSCVVTFVNKVLDFVQNHPVPRLGDKKQMRIYKQLAAREVRTPLAGVKTKALMGTRDKMDHRLHNSAHTMDESHMKHGAR